MSYVEPSKKAVKRGARRKNSRAKDYVRVKTLLAL